MPMQQQFFPKPRPRLSLKCVAAEAVSLSEEIIERQQSAGHP
jgi:hypothetical protein